MRRTNNSQQSGALGPDCRAAITATPDADLTWLLHRAAQRMRGATEEQTSAHGLDLRAYVVLTMLARQDGLTQLELGQALGLDKTTLTVLLDRLEGDALITRRHDPRDRRTRIPELTDAGRARQRRVVRAIAGVERTLLAGFSAKEQRSLRVMLCELIAAGEGADRLSGSSV